MPLEQGQVVDVGGEGRVDGGHSNIKGQTTFQFNIQVPRFRVRCCNVVKIVIRKRKGKESTFICFQFDSGP